MTQAPCPHCGKIVSWAEPGSMEVLCGFCGGVIVPGREPRSMMEAWPAHTDAARRVLVVIEQSARSDSRDVAVAMLRATLRRADGAIGSGDLAQMVAAYAELQEVAEIERELEAGP